MSATTTIMDGSKLKTEVSASDIELESHEHELQSSLRASHIVELSRMGLTALSMLAGIAVLGLSADALKVYSETHVAPEFLLPLWPEDFDLRPTVALVAGGTIVVALSALSLLAIKVQFLRSHPLISLATGLATPIACLIVAIVAVALCYVVNPNAHTVQSWTCRWREVPMQTQPHFGTLCNQGEVGLGLAVFLIPLEVILAGVAAYSVLLQSRVENLVREKDIRKGSPALS